MPNSCYGTRDVGDYAPFPTLGENVDPSNQAVRTSSPIATACTDPERSQDHTGRDTHHRSARRRNGLGANYPARALSYHVRSLPNLHEARFLILLDLQWSFCDNRRAREVQCVARECPEIQGFRAQIYPLSPSLLTPEEIRVFPAVASERSAVPWIGQ